jgi:hypothetical protein
MPHLGQGGMNFKSYSGLSKKIIAYLTQKKVRLLPNITGMF